MEVIKWISTQIKLTVDDFKKPYSAKDKDQIIWMLILFLGVFIVMLLIFIASIFYTEMVMYNKLINKL